MHPAPKFQKSAVVDSLVEKIALEDYSGKWVVLMFVPLAFTFVCPTEICAFNDAAPQFENRNAQLLFASTDSEFSLMAWNNRKRSEGGLGSVQVPLIADTNFSLARDYEVLVEEEGIALRGTFIISPQGELVYRSVNDTPVGRSVDEVLRVIDAFQFVEEHGDKAQ